MFDSTAYLPGAAARPDTHHSASRGANPGAPRRAGDPPRPAARLGILLLAAALTGCSMFDPPPDAPLPGDRLSPATVADLHVASATRTSSRTMRVCFTWTAPGDDGLEGQATTYQFAYASDLHDMLSWSVDGIPPSGSMWQAPVTVKGRAKEAQCFDLNMPVDRMPFFFAMRTRDNVDNISDVSNIVTIRP